ncbi:fibronectin type III domain-containing protein, partial [Amycolatopsis sp.]|uniref:fibronectin type III domain-containing protein n=1 Tax=Amycolatopsis sp. TaxID=37632 RepID=UPI0039C8A47E
MPRRQRQLRRFTGHPPGAPANLRLIAKSTKSVALAWHASAAGSLPVTGYDVYQGTSLAASVTGTNATVSGLAPGTAYSFTVKAKDGKGNVAAVRAGRGAVDGCRLRQRVPGLDGVDRQHRCRRLRRLPGAALATTVT